MTKRLIKSTDKKLFGVAGGVAEYFDIDPTLARVVFIVLCFWFFPLAIVAYLGLAVLMPPPSTTAPVFSEAAAKTVENGKETSDRRNLIGWAVVGLGILIVVAKLDIFTWPNWGLAAVVIGVGVVLISLRSRAT